MYYPLNGMDFLPTSYQIFYNEYTILKYPPEAFYYASMSSWDFPAEVTIQDLY